MIEIEVTASLNNGKRSLTATDKIDTLNEAYYSVYGFVTWFVGTFAKSALADVTQQLKWVAIKADVQAVVVFEYYSNDIKLQATSKLV